MPSAAIISLPRINYDSPPFLSFLFCTRARAENYLILGRILFIIFNYDSYLFKDGNTGQIIGSIFAQDEENHCAFIRRYLTIIDF